MRPLRFVGLSEDGTSVILETEDGAERFTVPNDSGLKNAVTRVVPPPTRIGEPVNESATTLSPRDIQTRVRAGESPQALASESGTSLERVMRFADPVLQERIRVTNEARRGRARKGSEGGMVAFGDYADTRLAAHGIEPSAVRWDAYRREDGGWTVTASFCANDKDLTARFAFALSNRTVSALDEIASDLLAGGQIQALLPEPPPPVLDTAEAEPVRLASVPDPDDQPAAEPIPLRPPGGRARAHTRHVPVAVDDELIDQEPELFDQTAFDDWHEPHLPLELSEPAAAPTTQLPPAPSAAPAAAPTPSAAEAEAEAEETSTSESASVGSDDSTEHQESTEHLGGAGHRRKANEKPRMPSWDDILLGVRGKD